MSELSEQKLNEITLRLRERQQVLWEEVSKALSSQGQPALGELRGQGHDSGDESVADMLSDLDIAAVTSEAEELQDIELAFIRIRTGSYGTCIDCGKIISIDRLEAFPVAKRCIDCQTKHENYRGGKDATPSL